MGCFYFFFKSIYRKVRQVREEKKDFLNGLRGSKKSRSKNESKVKT